LQILIYFNRIRRRCGQGCSSGGTGSHDDGGFGNDGVYAMTTYNIHSGNRKFYYSIDIVLFLISPI
jgi:hypothetical protein